MIDLIHDRRNKGCLFTHPRCRKSHLIKSPARTPLSALCNQLNHLSCLHYAGIAVAQYTAVMIAQSASQTEKTADLRSVHTSNLPELFDRWGSLVSWDARFNFIGRYPSRTAYQDT
jgi:hypothetical protein